MENSISLSQLHSEPFGMLLSQGDFFFSSVLNLLSPVPMCLFSLFLSSHCLVLFYSLCFVGVAEEQGNQKLGEICLKAADSESHSIEREFSLPLSLFLFAQGSIHCYSHSAHPNSYQGFNMEIRIPLSITTTISKIILIFYL